MVNKTGGDVFDRAEAEKLLFPASGLPGGGQLEVRMEISADHPDPDVRGVARRVKFFNLESWHKEWTEVAKKNEELACRLSNRTTANKPPMSSICAPPISIAAPWSTWRRPIRACCRLIKNSKKILTKPGALSTPPFERVEIPYEGHKLPAHFWPGRGKPGTKLPVVYNYGGADGILLRGEDGGAGQYVRRGMSFIDVDGPGHGGTLRHHKLYAPPDSRARRQSGDRLPRHSRRTSIPSASACTVRAWAVIPARVAPRWRKESKPSPSGAAHMISSMISSIIIRRSRNACAG